MEKSYREIAKGTFGGVSIKPDVMQMRYMVQKNGKAKLKFKLGADVLKRAKLQLKDKIDLIVDSEAGKVFIRPDNGGWKIDPKGSGKSGAGEFGLPWNSDKLFEFNNKQGVVVDWTYTAKKGIEFDIPTEVEA